MQIEVTADDIAQGKRGDTFSCPIARACCRAYGIEQKKTGVVKITQSDFYVRRLGQTHDPFEGPPEARRFIEEFDWDWFVQPFSFELPDIPDVEEVDDQPL